MLYCGLDLQVCALLSGGGYAEKVNVPAVQLLPIPKGISLRDAGAIPEVACTVWSTIFMTSHLKKGETLLVMLLYLRRLSAIIISTFIDFYRQSVEMLMESGWVVV